MAYLQVFLTVLVQSTMCKTCFSLFVNIFALQAAFLALLYRKRRKAGFIAHFKLLYLYLLGMVEILNKTARTIGLLLRDFKLCIFNTTVK